MRVSGIPMPRGCEHSGDRGQAQDVLAVTTAVCGVSATLLAFLSSWLPWPSPAQTHPCMHGQAAALGGTWNSNILPTALLLLLLLPKSQTVS